MALTDKQRREGVQRGLRAHDTLTNFLETGKVPDAAATSEPIADAVVMDLDKIFPTPSEEKTGWKIAPRIKADNAKHHELKRQIQEAHTRSLGINGTGIWQPVIVRRTSDPNKFYITAGGRRWRAAKEAGLTKIPVIVRDQKTIDAYETALVENLLREDMVPLDIANALQAWMEEADISMREIARRTGRSHSDISRAIGTSKDPVLMRAIEDGKITPSQAREMIRMEGPAKRRLVEEVGERRSRKESVPLKDLREAAKSDGALRTTTDGPLSTQPAPQPTMVTTRPVETTAVTEGERRNRATARLRQCVSVMAEVAAEIMALRMEFGAFSEPYKKEIQGETRLIARQADAIVKALDGKKPGEG